MTKKLLPLRRQTHNTTQQIANEQFHDTKLREKLDKMANTATLSDVEPPIPKLSRIVRDSVIDTKTSRMNAVNYEILAKLERIGVQARLTPVDMAAIKTLSRPEQSEIDAYNIRLRTAGRNANVLDIEKPVLEEIPKQYEPTADEIKAIRGYERIIRETETKIANRNERYAKLKDKTSDKTYKYDIDRWNNVIAENIAKLRGIEVVIQQNIVERDAEIELAKQHNKDILDEYQEKIAVLTTRGMSVDRQPGESDQNYLSRMQENIMVVTQQDQLFDGKLYLQREFISKMKSLNLAIDVVDNVVKRVDDVVKEWVLTVWNMVKTEFVKNFGTNPFRITQADVVVNFIMNLYNHQTADTNLNIVAAKLKDINDVGYQSFIDSEPNQRIRDLSQKIKHAREHPTKASNMNMVNWERQLLQMEDARSQELRESVNHIPLEASAAASAEMAQQYRPGLESKDGYGFRGLGIKKIHSKKLNDKNLLDVRHLQNCNIYGFPVVAVSDLFRSYVNRLLDNHKVSNDDIAKLNTHEQQLFRRLLNLTELNAKKDPQNIEAMKYRLQLIEDEIVAGNDNNSLLKEANEILISLAKQSVISKAEKQRFYKQLCKINN